MVDNGASFQAARRATRRSQGDREQPDLCSRVNASVSRPEGQRRNLAGRRKHGSRNRVGVWVRADAPPMQPVARIYAVAALGRGADAIISRRADHT
jgi:hypothetical protein